jgi:hypothetical protein
MTIRHLHFLKLLGDRYPLPVDRARELLDAFLRTRDPLP